MTTVKIYLVAINILALALFGIDKSRARHKAWRIPERVLILSAILGGSAGALSGMILFRHKTRHAKFTIVIPLALILHVSILVLLANGSLNTFQRQLF